MSIPSNASNSGIKVGSVVAEESNVVAGSNYLVLLPPTNDGLSPFTGTGSNSSCVFENIAGTAYKKNYYSSC